MIIIDRGAVWVCCFVLIWLLSGNDKLHHRSQVWMLVSIVTFLEYLSAPST